MPWIGRAKKGTTIFKQSKERNNVKKFVIQILNRKLMRNTIFFIEIERQCYLKLNEFWVRAGEYIFRFINPVIINQTNPVTNLNKRNRLFDFIFIIY